MCINFFNRAIVRLDRTTFAKQSMCISILKKFVEICDYHNLTYWIYGGSLIGLIRHEGFVPWDDDIDIQMPRPEIDRLFDILEGESDYSLTSPYWFDMNARFYKFKRRGCSAFIDIVPADIINYSSNVEELRYKIEDFQTYALKLSHEYYKKYDGKESLEEIMCGYSQMVNSFSGEETYYSIGLDAIGKRNHALSAIPESMLFPLRKITFSGISVNIPNEYDKYLRLQYHNYFIPVYYKQHVGNNKAVEKDYRVLFGKDIPNGNYSSDLYFEYGKIMEEYIRFLSELQDSYSHYTLAEIYYKGIWVKKDYLQAKNHIIAACKGNCNPDIHILAFDILSTGPDEDKYIGLELLSKIDDCFEKNIRIARSYELGIGTQCSIKQAVHYYDICATYSHISEIKSMRLKCYHAINQDINEILGRCYKLHLIGYLDATLLLADLYNEGVLVKQNLSKAKEYYGILSEYGNKEALLNLISISKSDDVAIINLINYCKKMLFSSKINVPSILIQLYEEKMVNSSIVAEQLKRLVDSGKKRYINNYLDVLKDIGTSESAEEYIKLATIESNKGNPGSKMRLAMAYFQGFGVEKNIRTAASLMREANISGQYANQLFDVLWEINTKDTDDEMITTIMESCESGKAPSMKRLAFAYLYGRGVEQNNEKAIKWITLSNNNGKYNQDMFKILYEINREKYSSKLNELAKDLPKNYTILMNNV